MSPSERAPAPRGGEPAHRRTTLTSRAAVLALVLCALVVMLADPLQAYLAQRAQLGKQQATNAALQRRVDALTAQQRLWSDPHYVRQQARERLYYVMPGETAYVVVGGPRSQAGSAGQPGAGSYSPAPTSGHATTWYGRLWSSVQAAGGAGTGR